mmetsp:Transcript_30733/g.67042  ORF Transcript_30733/g.67042 Transcript_30733/m.67042 type:complete len:289 (-) Transcript_30733:25-891(-)
MARGAGVHALLVALCCSGASASAASGGTGWTLASAAGASAAAGIEISVDALRELDSAGKAVGASESSKHSVGPLAPQAFTVGPLETVTVASVALREDSAAGGEGVTADRLSLYSPVPTIGKIRIDIYMVKEAGLLGPPNETWAVRAGDVGWSLELSNWSWCGCHRGLAQEVGDTIEVDVTVTGLFDVLQGASSKAVDLGGGASLKLSDQVMVDGAWAPAPEGFPRVALHGRSAAVTIRLPRFGDRAVYSLAVTRVSPEFALDEYTAEALIVAACLAIIIAVQTKLQFN